MGIPSYFSYIVKNHVNIIKKLNELNLINNFYLDSNSIIYDILRELQKNYKNNDKKFEKVLIKETIKKINEYIDIISPKNKVIIAFDGVAPVAKLEQQRTRRYKSNLLNKIQSQISNDNKKVWDKTAITPGTKFMEKLGNELIKYYQKKSIYKNIEVIVSTSKEVGEGEHKIFQYIREHVEYHKNTTTLIYGLDADLIMLCLNHLHVSKNIFLYRETPEFIKSINSDLEPNASYFLDIPKLGDVIIEKMTNYDNPTKKQKVKVLHDYIFLCFLLGNDFLPHFPSINIRSSGIHTLMAAYKNTLGTQKKNLSDGKEIEWYNLKILIGFLAECEHENIKKEYKIRNKLEKRFYLTDTVEDRLNKLNNIPTKRRDTEKYIDPFNYYWELRYYKKLFDLDINKAYKQMIATNYLEGLEWVFKYYTTGCPDWRWSYKFNYPPLLKDLLMYIPSWSTKMIEENDNQPVSDIVQLSYVLPRESLTLLSKKTQQKLMKELSDKYPDNCDLEWSFCKYFWEAHPKLPNINLNKLESLLMS